MIFYSKLLSVDPKRKALSNLNTVPTLQILYKNIFGMYVLFATEKLWKIIRYTIPHGVSDDLIFAAAHVLSSEASFTSFHD
jgi:hypothetical protein